VFIRENMMAGLRNCRFAGDCYCDCLGCLSEQRHCREHIKECHLECDDGDLAGINLRVA